MKKLLLSLSLITLFSSITLSNVTAAENISLNKNKWEVLQYSGIKANQVSSVNNSLKIVVDNSAGPLVYRLSKPQVIKNIRLDADLIGALSLKKDEPQGNTGNDDFALRIGLVYQGKKRLGFMQKAMAPAWVKKLFSLAPPNIGISHVEFFTVYQDNSLANKKRTHPLSELLIENYVIKPAANGKIKTNIPVPKNTRSNDQNVVAIWISSDGDDTQSKYSVNLNHLSVQ